MYLASLWLLQTLHGSILNCNDVPTLECVKLEFVATLTIIANPTNVTGVTVADITSTLAFTSTTTARLNEGHSHKL